MKKLLEVTPPRGKEFLQKIEHILERENNWVSPAYHLLVLFDNPFRLKRSPKCTCRYGGNVMVALHLKSNQLKRKPTMMVLKNGMASSQWT